MKILEVKNNLVKISYTSKDNLMLAGFVIIEDSQIPYVAQVMSLKAESGINYAIVKLLFTFDSEGVVKNYNGTIPEMNASITRLSPDELLDILPVETPLITGKIAQNSFVLNADFSILEKNLLICADKLENSNTIVTNFTKQITDKGKKSIVFDIDGTIESASKLTLGKDFKLPLNYNTINFIYENDLTDVNPTSKAVIQDVFLEVQEYANSVLDKFVPFDSFISVVDSQYREQGVPELALLKSRLLKYKEMGVFAQTPTEIHSSTSAIRRNLETVIDVSKVDSDVQRLAISTIYDQIEEIDLFMYSFVKINNDNSTKKLIRKIINKKKIHTTFISPHNYKYLFELKERASNMILFVPQTLQHDFAAYNIFLNKLNADECVIFGAGTQNIPLILEVLPLEELRDLQDKNSEQQEEVEPQEDAFSQETMMKQDVVAIEPTPEKQVEAKVQQEQEFVQKEEEKPSIQVAQTEPLQQELQPDVHSEQRIEQTEVTAATEEIAQTTPLEIEEPLEEEPANSLEELQAEQSISDTDDAKVFEKESETTLPPAFESETSEKPEVTEQVEPEEISEETDDPALIEDVPKNVSLEQKEDSFSQDEFVADTADDVIQVVPDDIISETVEDDAFVSFQEASVSGAIEEEDTDDEPLKEEEIIGFEAKQADEISNDENYVEPSDYTSDSYSEGNDFAGFETEEISVPIYPAEETPIETQAPDFQPGDKVSHPKYGEGIVEKLTKYGNKVLCSINFASGRKLIDPNIAQLTRA